MKEKDIVISVKGISKIYKLGMVSSKTMANDLKRWWYKKQGKEDPFFKIAENNDRSQKGSSEYVWALKDISFDVKKGEVLGIIGLNGAGKSTLLKILSRVTTPTTGQISIVGRMASLLEVGTGFHPELSGRENIFLNGAILGMTKKEIKDKFDEIVAFSGVERYIDTPVKRYSSGMYVRLAFAVAAHLEPEILVIDEVLAVGDAEFQKKCLGKMKDVATGGRTVLFVSHNMGAIADLCDRVVILKEGKVFKYGDTKEMIKEYISQTMKIDLRNQNTLIDTKFRRGSGKVRVSKLVLCDKYGIEKTEFKQFETIKIIVNGVVNESVEELYMLLALRSSITREFVGSTIRHDITKLVNDKADFHTILELNPMLLNEGIYEVFFWFGSSQIENPYDTLDNITSPLVIKNDSNSLRITGFTMLQSTING